MADKLYPVESMIYGPMQDAIKSIDPAREIAETTRVLNTPGAITNQQDRLAAQSYIQSMLGMQRGQGVNIGTGQTGTPSTSGASVGDGDSGRPPGMSDADWAIIKEYQTNPTGSTATPEQQAAMAGGDGSGSPLEWLKSQLGNVGLVVLGVVVVAIALVAATKSGQNLAMQAVKGAVV